MEAKNIRFYKDIGKNIKAFRKLKHISTEQLAEKINIAEGTIKNIESGAVASFQVYYDIAQALQVSLDSLTPDFMSSTPASGIKSTDMQLFIEIYKNTSSNERAILMNVIKSFHLPDSDND